MIMPLSMPCDSRGQAVGQARGRRAKCPLDTFLHPKFGCEIFSNELGTHKLTYFTNKGTLLRLLTVEVYFDGYRVMVRDLHRSNHGHKT